MNDALYVAATGLQAEQNNLQTISNNLANVNTTAYKRSVANFSELMYHETGSRKASENAEAAMFGSGVGLGSIVKSFATSTYTTTGSPLDVAIQGNGFFEVAMPDGSSAYTRGGTLQINSDGMLATQDGYELQPSISIGTSYQNVTIGSDGRITATSTNNQTVDLGRLDMVTFQSQESLTPLGNSLYRANGQSGDPIAGHAGDDGFGTVAQGSLESSNVNLVDEMVNLLVAQRAYGLDAKAFQAADEVAQLTNNLRK